MNENPYHLNINLDTAITVEHAINILNQALALDYSAIETLLNSKVVCNENLASHQTIQVKQQNNNFLLGVLGLLNGIFGKDKNGNGYIAVEYDNETGELIGFCKYKGEQE